MATGLGRSAQGGRPADGVPVVRRPPLPTRTRTSEGRVTGPGLVLSPDGVSGRVVVVGERGTLKLSVS